MNNYLKRVKEYIENNNMIRSGETLVLGVSGGPDSMCLFNMLYELFNNTNIKDINPSTMESKIINVWILG